MARNNHITNSFIAGEASGKFLGRTDTQQYNQALEDTLNVFIHPQGGASRRPGTYFVKRIVDINGDGLGNRKGCIFSFHATDGSRWQIVIIRPELGEDVRDMWQVIPVDGPLAGTTEFVNADWTNAALTWVEAHFANSSFIAAGLAPMQYAQIGDVGFFTHPNLLPFTIEYDGDRPTGAKFMLRQYPDFHDALVGKPVYDPIAAAYRSVTNSNAWRAMAFLDPVVKTGNSIYGLTLTNTAGALTLTAKSGLPPFTINSSWVGRVFKFTSNISGASKTAVVLVRSVVGTTANCTLIGGVASATDDYGYDTVDAFYEEGYWDQDKGFPRSLCFFEERIVFGGSISFPDTTWFSAINNYFYHDYRGMAQDTGYPVTQTTSSAFHRTLSGEDRVCEIRWLEPGKTIVVGTNFREFILSGPSADKTIGIDNSACDPETAYGSAPVQAVRLANATVMLNKTRREVRELTYSQDENAYKGQNLSVIGSHMAQKSALQDEKQFSESYFKQIVIQNSLGVIWAVDVNGALVGLTRDREQDVAAWHFHQLGGSGQDSVSYDPGGDGRAEGYYSNDDGGYVNIQSLAVLQRENPNIDNSESYGGEPDDLYLLVDRNKNIGHDAQGAVSTENYVRKDLCLEMLASEFERADLSDTDFSLEPEFAPVNLDCTLLVELEDNSSGIVAAADHQFGKSDSLALIIDGDYKGTVSVAADRTIDLSEYLEGTAGIFRQIILGYDYDSYFVPTCPEVPATLGSSQGQPRRIDQIAINFYRSVGCKFGRADDVFQENTPMDEMEEVVFSEVEGAEVGTAPVLFSGEVKKAFVPGYESRPRVKIQFHIPLPSHVTHIVSRLTVHE